MKQKLALSDEILMNIEKPARYIGNEINSVVKDKSSVDIRFAPVFTGIKLLNSSTLTISQLQNLYPEYIFIKIAMEKGGWHWHVFLRKIYLENPMAEIQKIKWIKKALDKNKAVLKEDDGSIRICLS